MKADPGALVGPRKETARIALTSDKVMKATVKLTSAPPSAIPAAGIVRPAAPPAIASETSGVDEPVPMIFCWLLLGVSSFAFLFQLWTFFSS
jgi:hypothetical protein